MNAYAEPTRVAMARFEAVLRGADDEVLDRPVAACPGWTLTDLAHHLGGVHRWARVAVLEQRGDLEVAPGPRQAGPLADWFAEGAAALRDALDGDPAAPAWSFSREPGHDRRSFWQRRQAHENAMHAWDAAAAVGLPATYDAGLAADGIGEVLEVFVPRMRSRRLLGALPDTVALVSPEGAWLVGDGTEPVATLTGSSTDLLLTLWHRDAGHVEWSGDEAAGRATLSRPLVP